VCVSVIENMCERERQGVCEFECVCELEREREVESSKEFPKPIAQWFQNVSDGFVEALCYILLNLGVLKYRHKV